MSRLLAFLLPDPDGELAALRDQVVKLTAENRRLRVHYDTARDERNRALGWAKQQADQVKRLHRQLGELREFVAALTLDQVPEVNQ